MKLSAKQQGWLRGWGAFGTSEGLHCEGVGVLRIDGRSPVNELIDSAVARRRFWEAALSIHDAHDQTNEPITMLVLRWPTFDRKHRPGFLGAAIAISNTDMQHALAEKSDVVATLQRIVTALSNEGCTPSQEFTMDAKRLKDFVAHGAVRDQIEEQLGLTAGSGLIFQPNSNVRREYLVSSHGWETLKKPGACIKAGRGSGSDNVYFFRADRAPESMSSLAALRDNQLDGWIQTGTLISAPPNQGDGMSTREVDQILKKLDAVQAGLQIIDNKVARISDQLQGRPGKHTALPVQLSEDQRTHRDRLAGDYVQSSRTLPWLIGGIILVGVLALILMPKGGRHETRAESPPVVAAQSSPVTFTCSQDVIKDRENIKSYITTLLAILKSKKVDTVKADVDTVNAVLDCADHIGLTSSHDTKPPCLLNQIIKNGRGDMSLNGALQPDPAIKLLDQIRSELAGCVSGGPQ